MILEINEVRNSATHAFAGMEILIGTKTYFISNDQKVMPGVRVGEFPHPGLGNPDWLRSPIDIRDLKDT